MVDIRQTQKYANYLRQIGWDVERVADINYFIKKIPLLGSVLKVQRPKEIRYKDIKILRRRYRVFQTIVEPKNLTDSRKLTAYGYKLSKSPYLPTKTLQLDLTKSEKSIFKNLKKDTKSALRRTMHYELHAMDSKIEAFRNAWKNSVGLKRYVPPPSHLEALKNSFKEKCILYSCINTLKQPLGGAIFLSTDKIAYYWQAFTNKEGRKALAQYRIVWEGILWAKKRGAKIFDFEGIFDEKFPNNSWLGFTHFKKSFGGDEISYPGTFIKTCFFIK